MGRNSYSLASSLKIRDNKVVNWEEEEQMKETEHLFTALYNRRSVRHFRPDPIAPQVLHRIMEAARWAPSGGNAQSHVFGIVTDEEKKRALAEAAGGQMWIAGAPVVIAACARLYKPQEESDFSQEVNRLRWGKEAYDWFQSCPNPYHMALLFMNSAPLIPGAHIQLAASAHGIGSCWIGYLDIARASDILRLPEDVRCYFLIPLGYPAEDKRRPRKPLAELTFHDVWKQSWDTAANYPSFGQLILRPYQPADEEAWLATWAQAAVSSRAWITLHHGKPSYGQKALELVAEYNGQIVGFIDVEIESKPGELGYADDSCCGFVWEFGVRPDHQGRGIAQQMIAAAKDWLSARHISRMEFWSMDEGAQAYYESLGMQELERHWQFYTRLPLAIEESMREQDKFGLQLAYGTCPINDLPALRDKYRIRQDELEKPLICIGYDYRW